MSAYEELIESKKSELLRSVVEALGNRLPEARGDLERSLRSLFDVGLTIDPPEYSVYVHLITASSFSPSSFDPDLGGGDSVKPGNIRLDMRRLLVAGGQTVRDIAGTVKLPWLLPMTALILWDRIWSLLRITITDKEACVVWIMWMNCGEDRTVPEAILLPKVNEDRAQHGHAPLSEKELAEALATLEKMRCIQRSRGDHTRWWLREWVSVKYR
jgi:hypothetical protein